MGGAKRRRRAAAWGRAAAGTAQRSSARHGSARFGIARINTAQRGLAKHGTARHGSARLGSQGLARCCWHSSERHGVAQPVRFIMAWLGLAGTVSHGTAQLSCHSTAQLCTACRGTAQLGTPSLQDDPSGTLPCAHPAHGEAAARSAVSPEPELPTRFARVHIYFAHNVITSIKFLLSAAALGPGKVFPAVVGKGYVGTECCMPSPVLGVHLQWGANPKKSAISLHCNLQHFHWFSTLFHLHS